MILMSIKPVYSQMIFSGEKKFELRRSNIHLKKDVDVFVYESAPTMALVGAFKSGGTIRLSLPELWRKVKHAAGVTEDEFFEYFKGKQKGTAIIVENPWTLKKSIPLSDIQVRDRSFRPPQDYTYLDKSHLLFPMFEPMIQGEDLGNKERLLNLVRQNILAPQRLFKNRVGVSLHNFNITEDPSKFIRNLKTSNVVFDPDYKGPKKGFLVDYANKIKDNEVQLFYGFEEIHQDSHLVFERRQFVRETYNYTELKIIDVHLNFKEGIAEIFSGDTSVVNKVVRGLNELFPLERIQFSQEFLKDLILDSTIRRIELILTEKAIKTVQLEGRFRAESGDLQNYLNRDTQIKGLTIVYPFKNEEISLSVERNGIITVFRTKEIPLDLKNIKEILSEFKSKIKG